MHSNKILPRNADIKPYMASNADVGTPQERFLSEFPNLPGTPTLIRCSSGKTAQPQFEYSCVIGNITQDAAFKVRFHQSFIFITTVTVTPLSQGLSAN